MAEIKGKIYRVLPTIEREYNGKLYYNRDLVLEITRFDQYTGEPLSSSYPSFRFSGDQKCRELEGLRLGAEAVVHYFVEGRRYNDKTTGEEKYFNEVKGFKIEAPEQVQAAPASGSAFSRDEVKDDLPW